MRQNRKGVCALPRQTIPPGARLVEHDDARRALVPQAPAGLHYPCRHPGGAPRGEDASGRSRVPAAGQRGRGPRMSSRQQPAVCCPFRRRTDGEGGASGTFAASTRSGRRTGHGRRRSPAVDHLPLPGRVEGIRIGGRHLGRRSAGHLPASRAAPLVAPPAARTDRIQIGRER